jgi:hypothetical protein
MEWALQTKIPLLKFNCIALQHYMLPTKMNAPQQYDDAFHLISSIWMRLGISLDKITKPFMLLSYLLMWRALLTFFSLSKIAFHY